MSFATIKGLLDGRQFQSLIGQQEDAWFDAKRKAAYDLTTPGGRYELAKDASAFANAEGGFIIVGLVTAPLPNVQTEQVTDFDLCTELEFDVGLCRSIIKEYTHPAINGLEVYWLPFDQDGREGLGVIEIPAQNAKSKYFLTKNVVESGVQIKQIVFGISKRNGAASDPLSVAELYRITQYGKNLVPETLARIEQKLDNIIQMQANPTPQQNDADLFQERTDRLFQSDET